MLRRHPPHPSEVDGHRVNPTAASPGSCPLTQGTASLGYPPWHPDVIGAKEAEREDGMWTQFGFQLSPNSCEALGKLLGLTSMSQLGNGGNDNSVGLIALLYYRE